MSTSIPEPDNAELMLDACEENDSKLTDWERKFIDDCQQVLGNGLSLFGWRFEKLREIHHRVTK